MNAVRANAGLIERAMQLRAAVSAARHDRPMAAAQARECGAQRALTAADVEWPDGLRLPPECDVDVLLPLQPAIPVPQAREVRCLGWRGQTVRALVGCSRCALLTDELRAGQPVILVPPTPERRGLQVLGCPMFLAGAETAAD